MDAPPCDVCGRASVGLGMVAGDGKAMIHIEQIRQLRVALITLVRTVGHTVKCQLITTKIRACTCGQADRQDEAMRFARAALEATRDELS